MGNNPVNLVDVLGLSPRDVMKIREFFEQHVASETLSGYRMNYPVVNNILKNTGLNKKLQLCYEQANKLKININKNLKGTLDANWTIKKTGTNSNFLVTRPVYDTSAIESRSEPGIGNLHVEHWWLTAYSDDPADPIITLDPWRNHFYLEHPTYPEQFQLNNTIDDIFSQCGCSY